MKVSDINNTLIKMLMRVLFLERNLNYRQCIYVSSKQLSLW